MKIITILLSLDLPLVFLQTFSIRILYINNAHLVENYLAKGYNCYMQKYKIITYGCQMNLHESEKAAGILRSLGYEECDKEEDADLILFNTCCIRDNAERRAKGNIGAAKVFKRVNPDLIIAVMGCMTQQDSAGEALARKFPFVDIVLGTNNLDKLAECVENVRSRRKRSVLIDPCQNPAICEDMPVYRTSGTNAWLNIMYGCNNFCTYCIVPYVRGRERSRTLANVTDEFKRLIDQGYKEVTLLGQNVNSYGKDLGMKNGFATLLSEIAKVDGDFRVRFMTSHPKDLNEEIVDIIASSKNICNNIHLPVQSGSDKILKLMNRHYTRDYYLSLIQMIRSKMPDCGITSDIMVGFPYEEDEDFLDTLDLVNKVRYSGAFTFVYSPRKGTPAADMPQVPAEVSKRRIIELVNTQNRIVKEISKEYEGKVLRVLCEDLAPKGEGKVCGRSECGRMVTFDGDKNSIGSFYDVKIIHSKSASLFGEVIK